MFIRRWFQTFAQADRHGTMVNISFCIYLLFEFPIVAIQQVHEFCSIISFFLHELFFTVFKEVYDS